MMSYAIALGTRRIDVPMISREEAIAFFTAQLTNYTDPKGSHNKVELGGRIDTWHYGKCELYDLIDAIYGVEKDE